MNILWIKDGKLGHEKQVKALLDELSETIDIKVYEEDYIVGSFQRIADIYNYITHQSAELTPNAKYHKKNIHLIIGAGSNTYARILHIKRGLKLDFNKEVLAVENFMTQVSDSPITTLGVWFRALPYDPELNPGNDDHTYIKDVRWVSVDRFKPEIDTFNIFN